MSDKVLLKMDGFEVTQANVDSFLQQMGQDGIQFNNEEGKKQIATELMNQHLLYLDAIENGLEEDEAFQKELALAKEQILRQYSMQKLLSEIEVSDDEAKAYFDENKDAFKKLYRYQASHILVEDEDKAKELKNKLDQGESFETIAREYSTCPSKENGGDLGMFTSGQMVAEFDTALETMENDEISDPVKTEFGYHIIHLKNKDLARNDDFASNVNNIKGMLTSMKQQELYLQKTNELQEKYKVEKKF